MRVSELAGLLVAAFEGDGQHEVHRVAALEGARAHELSFAAGKALKEAVASQAGCLLVPENFENAQGRTVIRVRDPRAAVAKAIAILHPQAKVIPGVHRTAVIGQHVTLGEGCSIGPFVTLGEGAQIGAGSSVGAGTNIGANTRIGTRATIHPRVTIYPEVTVGDDCVLHSGCVIGADGFGFQMVNGVYEKFPQIGRVEIGNRVEIGANSCIDRAALGVTSIGDGTKLDNMVHIAHNCRIGKHVVIAAQTGLAGGVIVEDYAVIGGQVGIGDKARIESRAVLGSGAGVLTSKIVRAGQVMWGTPARPLREYLEQLAVLARLAKKRKRSSG